jgi:hypothetical protein
VLLPVTRGTEKNLIRKETILLVIPKGGGRGI